MKIAAGAADRFVARPDPKARVVLVYGPDAGLVRERIAALVRTVVDDPGDPFRVGELTGAILKTDPARLADEAAARALTGGRRVVVVRGAGDESVGAVENALAGAGEGDALMLMEAGELTARARLRKLCEGDAHAAALPCYADDAASLARLVESTLGAYDIRAEREAVDYLVGNLGGDRQLSRGELEKLALYVGDGGTATLDDAQACVGDSAQRSLDDACLAAADGDPTAVDRALVRAWQEGTSPVAVLRAAQRHFQRLHLAAAQVRRGTPADRALATLRPPVFWKHRDRVRRQLERWPAPRAAAALDWLTQAELGAKSTGQPDRALCGRTLLRIAHAARMARESGLSRP